MSGSATMTSANVLCLFSKHLCSRDRLPGFDYCQRHILEDRTAPFRQCQFHVKAQRRCLRPAPKSDKKDSYCAEHSRKALMARQRSGRKRGQATAARKCLEDLSHHKRPKIEPAPPVAPPVPLTAADPAVPTLSASAPQSGQASGSTTPASAASAQSLPTPAAVTELVRREEKASVGRDVLDLLTTAIPSTSQRALEAPSEADSDQGEPTVIEASWRGDGDSDADSVDSDMEDPLKHAGSYSAEEVIRMMRDKLIRLQKLYIDQFQRLQYLLKEQRRRYRKNVRKEKEDQLMSIHAQPKDTPAERAAYERLKSLAHYNRPQGTEAVLHARLMEKRIRAGEGDAFKPPAVAKCTFNLTTSTKCGITCIPMSKYCIKHIIEDEKQVLFRTCELTTEADGPCENPIPDVFDGATCIYHTKITPSVFEEKEQERRDSLKEEVKAPKEESSQSAK